MTKKRVFFGREVLSSWDESKMDLECDNEKSAREFYGILCDAEDPYYFDEFEAHVIADKFGGVVGD